MNLIDRLRANFPELDAVPRSCTITGGSVRDALLGITPNDLDLAADDALSAANAFAAETGGRRITLGTRHQTERVVSRGAIYDFSPIQGPSLEADLARRDFTINAIGLDLSGELIDPFGGRSDIDTGTIRMIHEENLLDDPLRILRAVRMSATLGFEIERATADACRRHRAMLDSVAVERTSHELQMILGSRFGRRAAEDLRRLGLDEITLGVTLDDEDADAWETLLGFGLRPEHRLPAVLTVLLMNRPHAASKTLFDRSMWNRNDVRAVESSLEVLRAIEDDERTLLLASAHAGRPATERAEMAARARELEGTERLTAILEREPSPFSINQFLNGNEIARLTGARGEAIGRLKRILWEAEVLGEVRNREEAIELLERKTSGSG